MPYTNKDAKRLLKSELVKRGISNTNLVQLLNQAGVEETVSSVTSKISRGTFSAAFFLQCLHVIGCRKILLEDYFYDLKIAAEPIVEYKTKENVE